MPVIAPLCAFSDKHDLSPRRALAFVSRHQIAFMLPCACAIGFMIACTI
jgi:hypothetical protein